ncbi:MAG: hypothetical protein AB7S86_08095 [Hydrogenophaga sp.]|uniref:hypothetical protein n=1 Tax=Hydrogenophaga sp. TaxID=1904254 RepID=UPI003D10E574
MIADGIGLVEFNIWSETPDGVSVGPGKVVATMPLRAGVGSFGAPAGVLEAPSPQLVHLLNMMTIPAAITKDRE